MECGFVCYTVLFERYRTVIVVRQIFVVLEGLELLEGFDVEVLGRDEPYRVGRHEGIRVVPFVLRRSPCFGSFEFGTPHDAELESWFFLYSGF